MDLKDFHKYVEIAAKTTRKPDASTSILPDISETQAERSNGQNGAGGHLTNGHADVTPLSETRERLAVAQPALRVIPMPPRRGRGVRKEETREELLSRLFDPTLTLEETARLLEVCPTTVRRYTNKGILPHERSPGNQRRFKLRDVLAFMETQVHSVSDGSEDAD